MSFSRIKETELVDLLLSLAALTIAFAILGERHLPGAEVFFISAVGTGTGFLLHELAHKYVAQRYGYWAEYRANRSGLLLIIIMALVGFIFAAPGAVMIHKARARADDLWLASEGWQAEQLGQADAERKEALWISLAGPMTNIVLALLFFLFLASDAAANSLWLSAANFALFINLTLAAFNLLPFGPLDGKKIFDSNRAVWATVAIPTILVALPVYLGMI